MPVGIYWGMIDVMARPRTTPVGRRVAETRKDRGWNQKDLAARADVDASYISKVESGRIAAPSGEQIERLALALGVSVDELLRGKSAPPTPDEQLILSIRNALGTEKAHLFEAVFEALRELPPNERDKALEVIHIIATNWPTHRPGR